MRKRIFAMILLTALMLAGCGETQPVSQPEGWSYTFTDSTGASVTLKQKPQTVAVLFSSYAQIWQLSGGTVTVTVGESIQRGFATESAALVDDGAGKTIDHELLLAAQPDLVIGSADIAAQVKACQVAAKAGIPAALFRVDTFPEYLSMLRICTDMTGNEEAYQTHGVAVAERIEAIKLASEKMTDRKSILFIRAGSQYSSTKAKRAPENFVCTMLDELGAYNIADDAPVLLDGLSLEEILQQDPDCIVLTTMGSEEAAKSYMEELFASAGWRDLHAVKTKNYIFLPKELFHYKPNAHWDEAYRVLAEFLYPELREYDCA